MSDTNDQSQTVIDESLWRKTGGHLYSKSQDPGDPQKIVNKDAGSWNFQFSASQSDVIELWVTSSGENAAMTSAMGGSTQSFGKLNKDAVSELKNWLADILQKMTAPEPGNDNQVRPS